MKNFSKRKGAVPEGKRLTRRPVKFRTSPRTQRRRLATLNAQEPNVQANAQERFLRKRLYLTSIVALKAFSIWANSSSGVP
jgi:hypothetical protein